MKDLIEKLVNAFGPSGYEDEIATVITELISPHVDEVRRDTLGNVIGIKRGSGKKIMLAAHMDEIGIIVTHIDDKGFLRFSNVGGLNPYGLVARRVRFADGTVGVIHHEKLDRITDLNLSKMYIDIGCTSKEEAEKKVSVGDMAVFNEGVDQLGNRVVSKVLDDRAGCAALIAAAQQAPQTDNEIYYVFTTQEEVGTRGAKTAAFGIAPDFGIAVDVTLTGDTPEARTNNVGLGKGAAIKVKDSSVITHPKVKDFLVEVARQNDIPYQFEVLDGGGTDAGPIHLTREGVPTGAVSIPCRYVHSASEMLDLGDFDACVKLLVAAITADLSDRF
ncbi:MAG TPA: M42 family metallopeptidase [Firmicutes bacterium]|nr:M42 family metallopeptidase [Bacillota bacterium]